MKKQFILLSFYVLCSLVSPAWGYLPEKNCRLPLNHVERQEGTPHRLLHAIALGESGRKTEKGMEPWPWTVNAQGEGKFFPTKEDAVAYVRNLQSRGVKSIDVGCMQVNLYFHPHAFESIEEAFEPEKNIRYAAKFLKQLNLEQKSWDQAIAHYHSARKDIHTPYKDRVVKLWRKVKRFGFEGDLSERTTRPEVSKIPTIPAIFLSRMGDGRHHRSLFSSNNSTAPKVSQQQPGSTQNHEKQTIPTIHPPTTLTFFSLKKQGHGTSQQVRSRPVPLSIPARFTTHQNQVAASLKIQGTQKKLP